MSKPSPDLLLEAAALLLEGAGGDLFVTSLNKGLFYADLAALLETGKAITGITYLALPAGPVVAKYQKRVVGALEEAGLAEQDDSDERAKPLYLLDKPQRRLVNEEQGRILQRIASWAKSMTTSALSAYSHENPGWIAAWKAGLGALPKLPAKPIDLRIAMQQLVDDDTWLNGSDDVTAKALAEAESEPGTSW